MPSALNEWLEPGFTKLAHTKVGSGHDHLQALGCENRREKRDAHQVSSPNSWVSKISPQGTALAEKKPLFAF